MSHANQTTTAPANALKIAITGGIGAGKTYVCALLKSRGIIVYDCDAAARRIMEGDRNVGKALNALVGREVVSHGTVQKDELRRFILQSEDNKLAVDKVVHPAVATDFLQSGLSWLESAILFESGFDKRVNFDVKICVIAPLEVRINRIIRRDGITAQKARQWINRQMAQEDIIRRCNYCLKNDGQCNLQEQIDHLLQNINRLKKTTTL